jgi:cytoskeletal protein CcmA (bactofilin family)
MEPDIKMIQVDLREHGIMFVLPANGKITGDIELPGGALIQGVVFGKVTCARGSLILAPGSKFSGHAEADKIYVGGTVCVNDGKFSSLVARLLMAISSEAVVHADISSRTFAINSKNVYGSMKTLPALQET